MEKFERNGTTFTTFVLNDERYLCTGNPTGELKFDFTGEIYDYCTVVGATSVVSGRGKTTEELYQEWLKATEFQRNVIGISF